MAKTSAPKLLSGKTPSIETLKRRLARTTERGRKAAEKGAEILALMEMKEREQVDTDGRAEFVRAVEGLHSINRDMIIGSVLESMSDGAGKAKIEAWISNLSVGKKGIDLSSHKSPNATPDPSQVVTDGALGSTSVVDDNKTRVPDEDSVGAGEQEPAQVSVGGGPDSPSVGSNENTLAPDAKSVTGEGEASSESVIDRKTDETPGEAKGE